MNYYNEFDKKTAAWLRELIAQGHLPKGHVDDRSIVDVQPGDLDGYTQCHFFAGIGGWPYALMLSGWTTDEPVWTGSCPCQPFSVAGKGLGTKDERHLWPEMFRLIRECKPTTVFGEQVASKAGREWLAGVFADLEGMGYAAAGADLCAAGVGAPHVRQRLFWVADTGHNGEWGWTESGKQALTQAAHNCCMGQPYSERLEGTHKNKENTGRIYDMPSESGGGLVHTSSRGCQQGNTEIAPEQHDKTNPWRDRTAVKCADGKTRRIAPGITPVAHGIPARVVRVRGYGNAINPQVAAEFIVAFMACKSAPAAV